jgi:hypothetical protein
VGNVLENSCVRWTNRIEFTRNVIKIDIEQKVSQSTLVLLEFIQVLSFI